MDGDPGEITKTLQRWQHGSNDAENELFFRVLPDLHRIARGLLRGERPGHSLQSGDLVNQMYFKLVAAKDRDWESRSHFFRFVGRAMRNYLIDHYGRRPKAIFVPFEELEGLLHSGGSQAALALIVGGLLDEMESSHPEWRSIVDLKCFVGFTDQEAAGALGISLKTFQRRWHDARVWLYKKLKAGQCQKA